MNTHKVVVILHGWPRPMMVDYQLYKFFRDRNYEVVAPHYLEGKESFSPDVVVKVIQDRLKGHVPDVIVGYSLGGLVLPYVAHHYPEAKLVIIGSGTRFNPTLRALGVLDAMMSRKIGWRIARQVKNLPRKSLEWLLRKAYPFIQGSDVDKEMYEMGIVENVYSLVNELPAGREVEVINFIRTCDNRELLRTLPNKSLIFSGELDSVMPAFLGEELRECLQNSRIVRGKTYHHNLLNQKNIREIDSLLGD